MIRPLEGGIRISGPTADGTLGLVVRTDSYGLGFLTAGHAVGASASQVGQPDNNNPVGVVLVNSFRTQPTSTDVAFVGIYPSVPSATGGIWNGLISYGVNQIVNWPNQGDELTMQGARSGTVEGRVQYPNANVTFQSENLHGVSLATYPSQPADSGAPVLEIDGETVSFVGVHGGQIVYQGKSYSWFTPVATLETVVGEINL